MTFNEYFKYFSSFNSWQEAIFTFTALILICNIFVSIEVFKEKEKAKNEESNVYLLFAILNIVITVLFISTVVFISL